MLIIFYKVNQRSLKQESLQVLKELQVILKLSIKKTKQLISTLWKALGNKTAVEHFWQIE